MAQPHGSTAPGSIGMFAVAGGEGEESYSHNSKVWSRMGSILEPSLKDALLHHFSPPQSSAGPIHYADFGCAVGANTLGFVNFVVDILKMNPETSGREIVCHFVDLPSNDFNTLFKQLPPIVGPGGGDGSVEERTWFADGVPGSQYGRLFPRSSLHVAITTLALHYLAEIPKSVRDKSSPAYNKGRLGCHGSSPAAAKAFLEAARKGWRTFFDCRAEELASGGVLAFYCIGRRDRAHPEKQLDDGIIHFMPMVEKAWRELVTEGVIAEELLDSFNVPICAPTIDELQEAIEQHPTSAFRIQKLEFIDKYSFSSPNVMKTTFKDAQAYGKALTNIFKASMAPMLGDHLSPELMDVLVERFRQNSENDYPAKKAKGFPMYMSMCVGVLVRK